MVLENGIANYPVVSVSSSFCASSIYNLGKYFVIIYKTCVQIHFRIVNTANSGVVRTELATVPLWLCLTAYTVLAVGLKRHRRERAVRLFFCLPY